MKFPIFAVNCCCLPLSFRRSREKRRQRGKMRRKRGKMRKKRGKMRKKRGKSLRPHLHHPVQNTYRHEKLISNCFQGSYRDNRTELLQRPRIGGWIRRGWILRSWGAPIFHPDVPKPFQISFFRTPPKRRNPTTTDPTTNSLRIFSGYF